MPAVRYQARVGRMAAAVPVPASTPSAATGGACHVLGFPGTLAVPSPGPDYLPQSPALARRGYYRSAWARVIRPQVYVLAPPYPMRVPRRPQDRISPVPAITPSQVTVTAMKSPTFLGIGVMNNPRPQVRWPVIGARRGTYA